MGRAIIVFGENPSEDERRKKISVRPTDDRHAAASDGDWTFSFFLSPSTYHQRIAIEYTTARLQPYTNDLQRCWSFIAVLYCYNNHIVIVIGAYNSRMHVAVCPTARSGVIFSLSHAYFYVGPRTTALSVHRIHRICGEVGRTAQWYWILNAHTLPGPNDDAPVVVCRS